jgi:hypothetical protein
MDMRGRPVVAGFLGGALAGVVVYFGVQYALRRNLRPILEQEIPPLVEASIAEQLRSANITPQTGAMINRVLTAADNAGLI